MTREDDFCAMPPITCRLCGAVVEPERECYATPVCYACLPPPKPLPIRPVTPAGLAALKGREGK